MRKSSLSLAALAAALPCSTVAGGPPATEPLVTTVIESHPGGVGGLIVDQLGHVYAADFAEDVWRVDPHDRDVELWAHGLYGASGNTFDAHGNLYQASFYGNYVSRISRDGEKEVVVNEGLQGPVGLVFGDDGELFICSCRDHSIRRADAEGTVSLFATSEHFICPNGITRDAEGNLYVVSFSNPKVIKISPDGETSVFADSGGKGLGHITRVRGAFYATSFWDHRVYRISRDGDVTLLAGTGERAERDGPGSQARFSNPNGIYADWNGTHLYVNDYIGDPGVSGTAITPFSIRRIELPHLANILEYALRNGSIEDARSKHRAFMVDSVHADEDWRGALNGLGWELVLDDLPEEGVAVFELNAETYPDWPNAHRSLGLVYSRLGREPEAIAAFRRALELDPENEDVQRRLAALEAG